jgi:hypothetical protein
VFQFVGLNIRAKAAERNSMMNMHAATELLFGDAADLTSKLVPLSRTARL